MPTTSPDPDPLHALAELVDVLASEVQELRVTLAGEREVSPWMNSDEAAAYLKISRDTLDRYARERGHEDGGPVNVGQRRRVLRWSRETLDDWFRKVACVAAPKKVRPLRKASAQTSDPPERFDWSKV